PRRRRRRVRALSRKSVAERPPPRPLASGRGLAPRAAALSSRAAQPLALAARALPASFFRRRRTASVLPWLRESFGRAAARRRFFFCFSTLRAERMVMEFPSREGSDPSGNRSI